MALAVVFYHLSVWTWIFPSGSFGNMSASKLGNYGVQSFFLLSGFLLFWLTDWGHLRKDGLPRFFLKRYLRLAPLFYLAVVLDLVFVLGMGPTPNLVMAIQNFTLAFAAFHPNNALVTGGWCIGLEALFYVLFPFLAFGIHRMGRWFLPVVCLLLALLSLPFTLHQVMASPVAGDKRFHMYVLPANQMFTFLLGGVAAQLFRRVKIRLTMKALLLAASVLVGLLLIPLPAFQDHLVALTGWIRYWYLLIAISMISVFALSAGWKGPLLRLLARVGAISYGIYLFHPVVFRLWAKGRHGWMVLLGVFSVTVLFSLVAERWIERPILRLAARKRKAS